MQLGAERERGREMSTNEEAHDLIRFNQCSVALHKIMVLKGCSEM